MNLGFNPRWAWKTDDIKLVLENLSQLPTPVIHICSGSSNIGEIRLDKHNVKCFDTDGAKRFRDDYRGSPNLIGDMLNIPLKSGIAKTVVCDPPYDYKFFDGKGFDDLVCELVRICKPKGYILFYSPWVITHPALSLTKMIPGMTGDKRSYLKILSLHQKSNGQIGDYV